MQKSLQTQSYCCYKHPSKYLDSQCRGCRAFRHSQCERKVVKTTRCLFKTSQRCRSNQRSVLVLAFETGDEVEEDTMERMDKCVASVKRNFGTIRAGRASPEMLDRVMVDYYGAPTPLRQLAGISVPDNSMLVIQPYDQASMKAIERGITVSDLGLTPNNDGKLIRLNIPQLTAERRKDFVKQASKMAEDGKVAIRNVRRDSMKAIASLKLGEDEAKNYEDLVQETTDSAVKDIENMLKVKQEELTTM